MEEDGTIEGLELNVTGYAGKVWSHTSEYSRYFQITPGAIGYNKVLVYKVDVSDNLMHTCIIDAFEQLKALGYAVSTSMVNTILDDFNGFTYDAISKSSKALNYKGFVCYVGIQRTKDTPMSQPISLNEVHILCNWLDDNFTNLSPDEPYLFTVSGDIEGGNERMLKYGRNGGSADLSDYAYKIGSPNTSGAAHWYYGVYYQANEKHISYGDGSGTLTTTYYINGYDLHALDTNQSEDIHANPIQRTFYYSNFSFNGDTQNYRPNEHLRAIVDRKGNSKTPASTSSGLAWDDRYKQWAAASKKRGAINHSGDNIIKSDVPVTVIYSDPQKMIDHGYNNPNDPNSPGSSRNQDDEQSGRLPEDTSMDDINDSIDDVVDDYNDSRETPESLPDPVAPDVPLPDYPEDPGTEDEDETDDPPDIPVMPGMTASGMCSVYNPTKEQLKNFSAWLWSLDPLENLKKILTNPIDAIIGLHIMYATPHVTTASNIICGYLDSGVAAPVVDQQFIEVDCGYVDVPEYYGNATDYEPYTHVNCYLPFIGIVSLKANDVIGKRLYISYGVDVLTGTCLARLTTKKGSSMILLYTFAGNCSTQIPLTGGDYAQVIRGIASMAVGIAGSVLTANPLPAIGGVISGAMSSSLDVSRSGSIGANAGAMGVRKPYLIITRRAAYDASNYSKFYGYPANKTVRLGTCSGYTRVKAVHIDSMGVATDAEVTEIENLLRQGVIIK